MATSSNGSGSAAAGRTLRLIGGFELWQQDALVPLPPTAQRLVAYIGLRDRPILRQGVAAALWLETSDHQAQANLRSMLWRLHRSGVRLIETMGQQLTLARDVAVDVRDLSAQAWSVLRGGGLESGIPQGLEQAGQLLPDWYEDWVLIERERFRQLRVHALERLCLDLTAQGAYARAAEIGLAVVSDEPLRESGHRALIGVHIAEGNLAEAIRQVRRYESALAEELGIAPSEQMRELARSLRGS